ncbi:MAG: TerB family tellurite resistance protein [Hyphomicrobiaceae bacterium]|nr:TerB family tellurite resistance protein [Hyphomicrobiaceae bacterium]
MTIWGKLTGVAAGLALGGPLGALFGGVAGHIADRVTEPLADREVRNHLAFTAGVIALGAKLAKADGQVTRDEIKAFREVFKVEEGDAKHVARLFNQAKQDVAGYDAYADQLAQIFRDNPKMLENVLEGLFHIALADQVLHPSEERFLSDVAQRFGIEKNQFRSIKSRHVVSNDRDPYGILEISYDVDDEQLKKHYRALVSEHHPDRLIARGLPKEFIELANKRLAVINAAYEEIKHERGI